MIKKLYQNMSTVVICRRYCLCRWLAINVFPNADADEWHDHQFQGDFWTLPLVSYIEEVKRPSGVVEENLVRAFRLHHRPVEYRHRVLRPVNPKRKRIITLMIRPRPGPGSCGESSDTPPSNEEMTSG